MSPAGYQTRKSNTERRQNNAECYPFDDLATEYDAWFDKEGSLLFFIGVKAFKSLLPSLPKPWLEIGVGSGRFAQSLGIGTGVDPSIKLIEMVRQRDITAFLGGGEQELFDEESFGMPGGKIVLGLVAKESP
jgi:hypothetical protein